MRVHLRNFYAKFIARFMLLKNKENMHFKLGPTGPIKKQNHRTRLAPFLLTGFFLILPAEIVQANEKKEDKEDQRARYYSEALDLEPNIDNGRKLYKFCVACHGPEGWGHENGAYPQIAGQLKNVIIKQLDDIREGNRDNPIMRAFTSSRVLAGPQEIADVAGYIASLPMTRYNGRAHGGNLELGKEIYQKECAECHGDQGEGEPEDSIPLVQGQHYRYLTRQFDWIRDGRRKNADRKMVKQINRFTLSEQQAVLAYTAELQPPEHKLAPPGWTNPDFASHDRKWSPKAEYRATKRKLKKEFRRFFGSGPNP